jgi:integrase
MVQTVPKMTFALSLIDLYINYIRTKQAEFKVYKSPTPNGKRYWYIIGRPAGKRIRAWFESKEQAEAEATERNLKIRKLGETALTLDHDLLSAATEAATLLRPYDKGLRDAVAFYVRHLQAVSAAVPGSELCARIRAEFERRLAAGEASPRHAESMRETLRKFEARYGEENTAALTASDIKTWLSGTDLAIKTRNRHLGYVQNIFNIAKGWGLLATNPLDDVEPFNDPGKRGRKISVFTPEQLKSFLRALRPEFVPFFAICSFTGLHRSEVEQLDWSEIKMDRKLIDLPFHKSKNGKRKLIEISDNLAKILGPYLRTEGSVLPPKPGLQIIMNEAADKANISPWPQNVLRHSFCSNAVALKGLAWTAEQDDHSERILKRDYWEVVSKEDAARYWQIVP